MLAQKQPPFKKCVTAYWSSSSAPIMNGSKHDTEAVDCASLRASTVVEERRRSDTSRTERSGVGAYG